MNYLDIILVICSYLFGSIPYMLLRARMKGFNIAPGEDLHLAFLHKVGLAEAIAGILIDVLKGVLPVAAGFLLGFPLATVCIAGFAGVSGQMWSVFQKFDAEKGNTAGLGMAVTLTAWTGAWWVLVSGLACVVTGLGLLLVPRLFKGKRLINIIRENGPHTVSLPVGMLGGFLLMPVISVVLGYPLELTLSLAGLFFILAIRRITADLDIDLKDRRISAGRILLNRFLLDRSYL
jgi:acyl phosphate:glycerol-3-phosphate acyltransferase